MAYVSLTVDVESAHADSLANALLDAGALSVDVADPAAGTADETAVYAEPGEPGPEAWAAQRLTALFPAGVDAPAALCRAAHAAGIAESPAFALGHVAEQDWVRSSQAQFAPIQVGERLWIVPSWCDPVDTRAVNLVLDPGLAFGTGSHPTTRLCLRWLERHVRGGEDVLDYGCGSGILAIAASRLGARRVLGVDIDPDAVAVSRANAGRNGAAATFCVPASDPGGAFDLVAANILANPLEVLAPAIAARVRVGGRLVLAGLLDSQVGEVAAAYSRWFNIGEWAREEGWVALEGIRRQAP